MRRETGFEVQSRRVKRTDFNRVLLIEKKAQLKLVLLT
jgi:hypothetical protein